MSTQSMINSIVKMLEGNLHCFGNVFDGNEKLTTQQLQSIVSILTVKQREKLFSRLSDDAETDDESEGGEVKKCSLGKRCEDQECSLLHFADYYNEKNLVEVDMEEDLINLKKFNDEVKKCSLGKKCEDQECSLSHIWKCVVCKSGEFKDGKCENCEDNKHEMVRDFEYIFTEAEKCGKCKDTGYYTFESGNKAQCNCDIHQIVSDINSDYGNIWIMKLNKDGKVYFEA